MKNIKFLTLIITLFAISCNDNDSLKYGSKYSDTYNDKASELNDIMINKGHNSEDEFTERGEYLDSLRYTIDSLKGIVKIDSLKKLHHKYQSQNAINNR